LNWGASYLVNDFYKRFLVRGRREKHYVVISQVTTGIIMVVSCAVTYKLESIEGAWKFLIAIGAGTGSVLILRWFWWRINAWSEVFAMGSSFVVSLALQIHFGLNNNDPRQSAWIVIITVLCSTAIWLTATFATAPEKEEVLLTFYRRVRPSASFWGPIAKKAADVPVKHDNACNLLDWICGCLLVYMTLFGVGKLIFGQPALGLGLLVLATLAGWIIYWDLNRRGWKSITD
jgi:Na+/proline symporter